MTIKGIRRHYFIQRSSPPMHRVPGLRNGIKTFEKLNRKSLIKRKINFQ